MRNILFNLFICLIAVNASFTEDREHKNIGAIYRDSHEINALIPEDAVIEVLAEGFDWSEGPVWIKEGGCLLFNDIPQNTIYKWSENEGLTIFLRPAGYALGDNPP